jgi:hypothetical protein
LNVESQSFQIKEAIIDQEVIMPEELVENQIVSVLSKRGSHYRCFKRYVGANKIHSVSVLSKQGSHYRFITAWSEVKQREWKSLSPFKSRKPL